MKLLQKALADGSFVLDLKAQDMESIVHQALNLVVAQGALPPEKRDDVEVALLARERQVSTAIGHSVAVPHVYLDAFSEPAIVFIRLAHPLNLGAPDGIPTRFLFLLMGPTGRAIEHIDALANIARLMSDDNFRYDAGEAQNQQDLVQALRAFRERSAPRPVPEKPTVTEGLRYSGRLFGGLINDVRRRLPHYVSDIRDGLHTQTLGATLFLFFACLAPAVTFGGVMGVATDGKIGAVEMLLATAICGVTYALFSGQPLIILGGTGPLLIFTALLYGLCADWNLPFLPVYTWVGLWTMLFVVIMAVTDASCLMRFFTRFTDEIFAALISLIFIYEAVHALVEIFVEVYHEEGASHDRALLSLLLALGTFYIATNLSSFRRSRYLLPQMREFMADFGPTIALTAMTLVALFFRNDVGLDPLPAPKTFGPTTPRPWLVALFEPPPWVWLAAAGPALLVSVLVYLDQNITARLVNNPDNRLKKGEAYHLDLLLVGLLIGVCSLVGLPWLVAATVRSLNHLRSLATVEDVVSSNGDSRQRIIHVRENRMTGFCIHLLIGLSLLLLPYLILIPMAVLYGLFLFMGVVSMSGNQFFERLNLWLTDSSLYPAAHYIRRVPIWTIHAFTLLQLVCLGVLWLVKTSVFGLVNIGIMFPLFIALLVPIRFLAARFIAPEHLAALDAEEEPEDEETQWV